LFRAVTACIVIFYTNIMTAERTASMSFRVTPKFRRLLEAAAAKENRSLTNMLETLLLEFCAKHGIDEHMPSGDPKGSAASSAVEPSNLTLRQKAKRRS
jgi:hypothetical protein